MTFEEAKKKLQLKSQEHILKYFHQISAEEQERLLKQIEELDLSLLDLKTDESGKEERGKIEPIGALTQDQIEERKEEFRAIGIDMIRKGKVGAVLLAGGQGTRLGYDIPKGMINIGETKELYIFEQLIKNLKGVVELADKNIPLFIMTSEKNDEMTKEFFRTHNYFGYDRESVYFFVQEMAPSVGYDGKIFMENKGKIAVSPNGNGGWFSSMDKAGLLPVLKELGVQYLNVFSVDNVLQRIADPVFVGATYEANCVCGAKVVAKAGADERVGVLCLEDGKPSIVEYFEMTDEIRNSREADGKLTYNYGVILNYLFHVDTLVKIMNRNLKVHVVNKKIPHIGEDGELVNPTEPNGHKFESLVLDMIHMMDNCLSFEVAREKEFAPIKVPAGADSMESARELLKKNGVAL
jgi:UDP-N-acetylglucosamine/UDP-N-acetylgalactosamine diphosphorylase